MFLFLIPRQKQVCTDSSLYFYLFFFMKDCQNWFDNDKLCIMMNYVLLQFIYKCIHQHEEIPPPTHTHTLHNATVVESSSN